MKKSFYFQHNLSKYDIDKIEKELNKNKTLKYKRLSKDSKKINVGDIVYVYMSRFPNKTPNRIIFSAEVNEIGTDYYIIKPIKLVNNFKLSYSYLKEQNKKDIVFRNKIKISDNMLEYIEKEFELCEDFSIEKLKSYIEVEQDNYNGLINSQVKINLTDTRRKELNNRKPKLEKYIKNSRYTTYSELGKDVIVANNYECAIDAKHKSFENDNNEKYMEAHHLMPMKCQKEYQNINLDNSDNIICLCPLCHKKIHHGKYDLRKSLVLILYEKVKDKEFFKRNKITESKLLEYYK